MTKLLELTRDDLLDPWSVANTICQIAGHEFSDGTIGEIPGSRHHPRILEYSHACRRGGVFRGVDDVGAVIWEDTEPLHPSFSLRLRRDEDAWCAAFRSFLLLTALRLVEPSARIVPHGLRVGVRELVNDARYNGTLRLVGSGYHPKPGDACIRGRAGESPLRGGRGHVDTPISFPLELPGRFVAIGGNERNAIRVELERLDDPAIEAWIET